MKLCFVLVFNYRWSLKSLPQDPASGPSIICSPGPLSLTCAGLVWSLGPSEATRSRSQPLSCRQGAFGSLGLPDVDSPWCPPFCFAQDAETSRKSTSARQDLYIRTVICSDSFSFFLSLSFFFFFFK